MAACPCAPSRRRRPGRYAYRVSFLVIWAAVTRYIGRGPADRARRRAAREDRKRGH